MSAIDIYDSIALNYSSISKPGTLSLTCLNFFWSEWVTLTIRIVTTTATKHITIESMSVGSRNDMTLTIFLKQVVRIIWFSIIPMRTFSKIFRILILPLFCRIRFVLSFTIANLTLFRNRHLCIVEHMAVLTTTIYRAFDESRSLDQHFGIIHIGRKINVGFFFWISHLTLTRTEHMTMIVGHLHTIRADFSMSTDFNGTFTCTIIR